MGEPARDTAPAPSERSPEANEPAPSATSGAREPRRYRVAFMGDSLTDYASHGGLFIRYLEERCPKSEFDNFGKGAEMVNQMRRRFQAQVTSQRQPYTHIVIFGGVNDLYSDLTAHRTNDKIQHDLSQMYAWARASGAQVVALTVAPWGGFRRYFNERRHQSTLDLNDWILKQQGTSVDVVIDAHQLLRCGDPRELCPEYAAPYKDGIHFGKVGHRVLGEALFERVFANCL